jgi:serine/threonine protein kinase
MLHLAGYTVLRELGRRGLGVEYLAADPRSGSHVAIKTIRTDMHYAAEDLDAFRARLLEDVRLARTLTHPNLVTLTEAGHEGDLDYIVTEYVNGRTLSRLLAGETPEVPESLRILADVAHALDYVHQAGIVHDHVEPDCILIPNDGAVKLSDLGAARITYFDVSLARYPQSLPAIQPHYLSPEFIRWEWPRTGRSDQFSLAAVAYRLLTGRTPHAGEGVMPILAKIMSEEPAPPHSVNPALSPRVDSVFRRALCKDSAGRFATCTEFVQALRTSCEP